MSADREQILSRVNRALAPLTERAALPDWEAELVVMRQARGNVDVVTVFAERLRGVNGVLMTSVRELVTYLEENKWTRGYCDPAIWAEIGRAFPHGLKVETSFDRARVDEYQFGITRATAAIAETGTVVLTEKDTTNRLAALAPWVHIAVVARNSIHLDLPSAVAAMPQDANIVWCTGPSKTADVEGILIEGVHGPGIQIALLLG